MRDDEMVDSEVERIALALRRPVDLGPDVDRAVMGAIRAAPLMVAPAGNRPALRSATPRSRWAWLVRPRAVRLSVTPIGAMAAAAVTMLAVLVGLRGESRVASTNEYPVFRTNEHPVVNVATRATDTVFITKFVLVAPNAKQVALVGDFNDWDHARTQLTRVANGGGLWTIDVPLPAGAHKYSFLVDGKEWMADPTAPRAADDFGQPSSVVTVEARRS